jgi:hypothetical protein
VDRYTGRIRVVEWATVAGQNSVVPGGVPNVEVRDATDVGPVAGEPTN